MTLSSLEALTQKHCQTQILPHANFKVNRALYYRLQQAKWYPKWWMRVLRLKLWLLSQIPKEHVARQVSNLLMKIFWKLVLSCLLALEAMVCSLPIPTVNARWLQYKPDSTLTMMKREKLQVSAQYNLLRHHLTKTPTAAQIIDFNDILNWIYR